MKARGIINPLVEAIEYFRYKANGETVSKHISRVLIQREINRKDFEDILKPALELEAYLDSNVALPQNLQLYFADFEHSDGGGFKSCAANIAMLSASTEVFTDINIICNNLIKQSRSGIRDNIMSELISHNITSDANADDGDYFLQFIDDLPLSDKAKWHIVNVYNHYEEYVLGIGAALRQAIQLIQERSDIYEPYLHNFEQEYSDINDIIDSIRNNMSVDFLIGDDEIVYPKILANNEFTRIFRRPENGGPVLYIGLGVRPMFKVPYKERISINCEETLKVLGDKNRLAILRMLKYKDAYGQEIADMQKLSPNTISHHMSKLQSCNLTKSTLDGSKVYYSSNQRAIKELIEQLSELLLRQ